VNNDLFGSAEDSSVVAPRYELANLEGMQGGRLLFRDSRVDELSTFGVDAASGD
jgi:hypothetical protein